MNYIVVIQEPAGKTIKGYDDRLTHGGFGEINIKIYNNNNELNHIVEALILTNLNKSYMEDHFRKIIDNQPNGLPLNFIIIFAKYPHFDKLWMDYIFIDLWL